MSNKFLGLESVKVFKEYIDEVVKTETNNTKLFTLHAYTYAINGTTPNRPTGGSFTIDAKIDYPYGWSSLKSVIDTLCGDVSESERDSIIEAKLREGSVWMSAGTIVGQGEFTDWSYPIKISGQNGVTVQFKYAYRTDATEWTNTPSGVNSDETKRKEYVWMKYGDGEWSEPTLWAVYTEDASDVLYRFCTTADINAPAAPTSDVDDNWMTDACMSLSESKPYMWMTHKRVHAGANASESVWANPILFGHYGKDGLDGNIPSYSVTLYAKTNKPNAAENIVAPEFVCEVGDNIYDVKELNGGVWSEIPPTGSDINIWWYVVINVNGGTRENPETAHTVSGVSKVMRFSAIDGVLTSYPKIVYKYYWSSTQELPEGELEWSELPTSNPDDIDGSLWMIAFEAIVNTIDGTTLYTAVCNPVKITGPRGPIAYDYRVESQFAAGNDTKSTTAYKDSIKDVKLTENSPYIWEKRYLMLYKMTYGVTGDVIEDTSVKPTVIKEYDEFRLSGLNGKVGANGKDGVNGNRLNTIDYTVTDKNLGIYNFDEVNYFISNSADDTHYVLNGNKFGNFESGYTGKFINIGTGNMIITTVDANIVGSNTSVAEIVVKPQESIDLIGYNNDGSCEFILIGKAIEDINNPVADPGILSEASLLDAITTGGEVKLGNNIELSSTPLIIENDVVVDLNGYTITAPKFTESGGDVLEGDTDSYAFWVKDGNLTIKGKGKVVAQHADYSMAVWCQGGNVIIEDGEYRNGGESCSLIYASGTGNIVIKGGKFIATPKGTQEGTGDEYTALNLKDKDIMTCSITAEGGHYYGFDPANNSAEDNADWWEAHPNGFVADGFTSIKNGDFYSIIPLPEV